MRGQQKIKIPDTKFLQKSAPRIRKKARIFLCYLVRLAINVGDDEDIDYEMDGLEFANGRRIFSHLRTHKNQLSGSLPLYCNGYGCPFLVVM